MNILMCTNYPPVEVQKTNGSIIVNEGWVDGIQRLLIGRSDVCLHVVYPQNVSKNPVENVIGEHYFTYGYFEKEAKSTKCGDTIITQVADYIKKHPIDVIHIMGTEFPHSLFVWQACKKYGLEDKVVVSMQGLVSKCAEHYLFGVTKKYRIGLSVVEIYNHFSSLNKAQKEYAERGRYEMELLEQCKQVIGRTNWDRRCAEMLNPSVKYYYNSENLRAVFYGGEKWRVESCEKYSIFISQATYALKGLHHVLLALPKVVEQYPETKLYVAGNCPINQAKWKRNSYARFLEHLIHIGRLQEHVVFCGQLSAGEMYRRHLKSHIFLSPSNIENSSNSIGEAMLLGVPTVASAVGGTDCIIKNGYDGFTYPLNEPYIMAQEIIEIFRDDSLARRLSENAIISAEKLYDREKNVNQLMSIYNEIASK